MHRSRRSSPFVVLVALTLLLPLAACGRKGPLDPPPGGFALDASTTRTPVTSRGLQAAPPAQQGFDESGRPLSPAGANQRHPADWLLD